MEGPERFDRTGVVTRSLFGVHLEVPLSESFPLLTTKKVHFKSILCELFWFLRGETNIRCFHQNQITIWDEWADANGELGPIYGHQGRAWPGYRGETYDQLQAVIDTIRTSPYSRRLVVFAWNVGQLAEMRLPPCHVLCQFYADRLRLELSLRVYQRSADVFLGLPFNMTSYALLLHMVAQCVGYNPHHLLFAIGDAHLYKNHEAQARLQLERKPYALPTLRLNPYRRGIDECVPADVEQAGY